MTDNGKAYREFDRLLDEFREASVSNDNAGHSPDEWAARERLRAYVDEVWAQYRKACDETIPSLRSAIDSLKGELARVPALVREVEGLREENAKLKADVARLRIVGVWQAMP